MGLWLSRLLFLVVLPLSVSGQDSAVFKSRVLGEVSILAKSGPQKQRSMQAVYQLGRPLLLKRSPSNLQEGLSAINGVLPVTSCNVCNASEIRINGLEGPYNLITIDGMPMMGSLASVYGLTGFPSSLIERIEVTKGPANARYWSESMGGTINLITREPVGFPIVFGASQLDSYGEHLSDLGFSGKSGKSDYLMSASYLNFKKRIDLNGDHFTDAALTQRLNLFGKFRYRHNSGSLTQLSGRVLREDRFGGEMNWNEDFRGGDSIYGESIRTNRLEGQLLHRFRVGGMPVSLRSGAAAHRQDAAYGKQSMLANQSDLFHQLEIDSIRLGQHIAASGLTLNYQFYQAITSQSPFITGRLVPGLFAEDEWKMSASWRSYAGVRLDYFPVTGWVLSPRFSVRHQLDEFQSILLNGGRGFRVVNLFTEDHAVLTGSRKLMVSPDLRPERGWNFYGSYQLWKSVGKGFLEAELAAFYTFFSNKIVADYDTDPNMLIYRNLNGNALIRGFSLDVDWVINTGVSISAAATVTDASWKIPDASGIMITIVPVQIPSFTGNYGISLKEPKTKIALDVSSQVVGPMRLPLQAHDFRPEYSPVYQLLQVQVSRKMGSFEVFGGVKNLLNFLPSNPIMRWEDPFDKKSSDPVSNPHGYSFDTTYSYAPMLGRRGYFGVRFNLAINTCGKK